MNAKPSSSGMPMSQINTSGVHRSTSSKATAADVTQAQAMLAQTQDQLLKAQQTLQTALIGLSRWTATPVSDVTGEPPAPHPPTP